MAACCLLSGCSKTASDEDVFGNPDPAPGGHDPVVQQTPADEGASPTAEPSEEIQDSAAPESGANETDMPPETGDPASFQVSLADEFAPLLRPNQYVNYEGATNTVAMAATLTRNISKPLDKVGAVYNYVVSNLSYDRAKAASVTSGYLPNLDSVLSTKTGICFDYAALMTGMLRSQGIPCKLVVGYAGTTYHAWVSVWTQETGWVDNAIYFDGTTWHRMDPTFASSGGGSSEIMQYIGNGSNYTVKYLY